VGFVVLVVTRFVKFWSVQARREWMIVRVGLDWMRQWHSVVADQIDVPKTR